MIAIEHIGMATAKTANFGNPPQIKRTGHAVPMTAKADQLPMAFR